MVEQNAPGYGAGGLPKPKAAVSYLFVTDTTQQPADPLIGQLITGRYRVVSRIGEGGMGTVYAARHEAIEKKIALKVLHKEYSANPEVVDRFKQEAISASRIKHNNVIDIFDFGQLEDGSCFIAMEFLEGQDLGDALQGVGAFSPEPAIRIILQVCGALSAAHARGVIHRDMKPENIFLQTTAEGDHLVKIVDFGIAQLRSDEAAESAAAPRQRRLTKTGMIFGTPEYMAPEQARGRNVDQRSDVYSTGVILYELLSGGVPFTGESFLDVLNKHCLEPVPPIAELNPDARLSQEVIDVVQTALAKDPSGRFASMKDLATALLRTPEGKAMSASISAFTSFKEMGGEPGGGAVAPAPPISPKASSTAIMGSRGPTPLAGSATTFPLPTRSNLGIWLLLGALVMVGGGIWVWVNSRGESIAAKATSEEAPAGEESPSAQGASAERPPEAPPPTEQAPVMPTEENEQIVLHVESAPTGAIVMKDGFQVCDATPCDVVVEHGEAVTLEAQKGAFRGQAKVLAQREQKVSMALSAPQAAPRRAPSPRPAPTPEPKEPEQKLCEVVVNGLKILRPCE